MSGTGARRRAPRRSGAQAHRAGAALREGERELPWQQGLEGDEPHVSRSNTTQFRAKAMHSLRAPGGADGAISANPDSAVRTTTSGQSEQASRLPFKSW